METQNWEKSLSSAFLDVKELWCENTKWTNNDLCAGGSGNVRKNRYPIRGLITNTECSAPVFSGNQYKQSSSNDDDHAGQGSEVSIIKEQDEVF